MGGMVGVNMVGKRGGECLLVVCDGGGGRVGEG